MTRKGSTALLNNIECKNNCNGDSCKNDCYSQKCTSRNTLQRNIVKAVLCAMHCHTTADELAKSVQSKYPTVSKATVYRNLKVLVSNGEVLHIPVPDGADYYESMNYPHYHIKCTCCGKIADIALPYMDNFLENAKKLEKDFCVTGYSLSFSGICPDCKNK